ncbi:MAG: fumarylacetoacetate hydrolase family protein, partial [Lentisphaerae bacterium]|nr:fumarylacetoacetate hydrolase family protein [Lentisphaerota bacterium]
VELAVVIGKKAKNVTVNEAMNYVAGFTILNDVSERIAQRSDGQWFRAKSVDTFCPIGPFLVTMDELSDWKNLRVYSKLNGNILQDGNTSDMMMTVPEIIAYISKTITLLPGTVIATGTPAGIGSAREPQLVLQSGDKLETCIDKLGQQTATIR